VRALTRSRQADPEIWLFDDAPILGGAEVFALRLARFVRRQGSPSLRIVCPSSSEMAQRCLTDGVPHVPASFPALGPTGVPRWPRAVLGIRALLGRLGPQAIAAGNTARAQAYLAAAAPMTRHRPRIVNLLHEQETLGRVSGRFAFRRLGTLVAVGGNVAAACERALPGVRVREANLFCDPFDVADPAPPRLDARVPAVGVLTRLIPEKGILELVDELSRADTWSHALIAGPAQDRGYARRVVDRIAELGLGDRISLIGYVDDLGSFFASIDVLISPSTGSEGQGMGTVEALWHGRPSLVRKGAFSARDFEGLPVLAYEGPDELDAGLRGLSDSRVPLDEVHRRFGPEQALTTILAAGGSRP
jgi:glycosyltransferase involved in cell wall biosynthesis